MEFSSNELVFPFQSNTHLVTNLTLKNTSNFNQMFKFKASTANRFIIKPNVGSVQPSESISVQIVIHKEIVQNYENQKVQLLYGKSLEDPKSVKSFMFRIRLQKMQSQLNLTKMVESKQSRVKELEDQVRDFKMMPTSKIGKKSKSSKFIIKLVLAIIIGLLIGFFGPIKIFKKKIIRKNV